MQFNAEELRRLEDKNILVTGATGFLGKRLLRSFFSSVGSLVVVGRSKDEIDRIKETCPANANLKTLCLDLCNENDFIKNSTIFNEIDIIVHLAADVPTSGTIEYHSSIQRHIIDNTVIIKNLVQYSNNVKFVVFSSSVYVYEPCCYIIDEFCATRPVNLYGLGKLLVEEILRRYYIEKGVKVTCLRFSQIYGPDEPHGLAITKFVEAIKNDREITLFNGGNDVRDLLFVGDAVNAIKLALLKEKNGVYNISSGIGFSIRDIAEKCIAISGKKINVTEIEKSEAEESKCVYGISKAQEELNFVPEISLDEGIKTLFQSSACDSICW